MWASFCEHLRECGRSGNLFVLVILLIFGGSLFGPAGIVGLLCLLGMYLLWLCGEMARMQNRFEKLGPLPPLANRDLRVAQSRLAKSHTQRLQAQKTQRLKTQRLPTAATPGLRLRPR